MEPPQKLVVIKSPITGIGWKDAYKQRLMELLEDDNTDNVFNLEYLINEDFFREVFMSLLSAYKMEKRKKTEKLETFKTIINKHRETFLERTSYKPIDLRYGQQIANYEVTKIRTAYINNEADKSKEDRQNVYSQMNKVKLAVSSKKLEDATSEILGQDGMNIIRSFIGCYSEDYKFEKGSIFMIAQKRRIEGLFVGRVQNFLVMSFLQRWYYFREI
ncbi:hypothetical protein HPULCUR_004838 [Helicostylum pulchrum]|uniref:Uncharacterized protein n=1 Tax=Helicostylum pulchrum TaxID=562976 RepID=A0ABP9XXD9_9FUNG